MLGIVTMAGNAFRAFGNMHPAIKWGVVVLAGLLAVEFVGKEAISVYVAMQTAPAQIEQANGQARQAKAQADAMTDRAPSMADVHARIDCEKQGGTWDATANSCKSK